MHISCRSAVHAECIVVKNIDVRIKNIKKHVLYPIIKNMKKTFVKKNFPYSISSKSTIGYKT